jgi:uncharacterized repeat protein (TIGR01451 family)
MIYLNTMLPSFKLSNLLKLTLQHLITIFVVIMAVGASMLPIAARAQAAACSTSEVAQVLVIPAGGWAAGTTGPYSFTVGTGINAITVTYSVVGNVAFGAGTPALVQSGGLNNVVQSTHTVATVNTLLDTQIISFSRPINKLALIGTDIDYSSAAGGWQDQVVARVNGTILPTSMVGGANHTINLATGTATATTSFNCAATDTTCNVTSGFNVNGITTASQEFRTGPNHRGGAQVVGATSFGWCATKLSNITLAKTWSSASVNDAVTVAASGATPALVSLNSVANTATETDTGALQTVLVGSVLNLSENFTTGAATNYAATLACTGTTGLVGNTLTVGAADTAIVCTYTNKSIAVALTITKTDSKTVATSGGTNNYVVTVSNAGPAAADGVVVTDVVGAGLTCPATNPVTCSVTSGAAVCPAGALTFANLTAGITIATFPNASALQFAYTCNVN